MTVKQITPAEHFDRLTTGFAPNRFESTIPVNGEIICRLADEGSENPEMFATLAGVEIRDGVVIKSTILIGVYPIPDFVGYDRKSLARWSTQANAEILITIDDRWINVDSRQLALEIE